MSAPKLPKSVKRPSRWPWFLALVVLAAALAVVYLLWGGGAPAPELTASQPGAHAPAKPSVAGETSEQKGQAPSPPPPSKQGPVVELKAEAPAGQAADTNQPRAAEQAERKEPYGLQKSVDAVVRSDESIALGGRQVSVADLERKLAVEQRGEMLEKPLDKSAKVSAWGVHVVRPGESLWSIHYQLLREYLAGRGVNLPPSADQPLPGGQSSGVGKILKFAEHMVGVYNLQTGHMTSNLNLLEPGHKVVVFNLSEIFSQLNKIDPRDLTGIMYDGRVLLFPQARQSDFPVPPPGQRPPGNPGN